MRRILLVNGNTTTAITEDLAAAARHALGDGVEIVAVTPPFGPAYVRSRPDCIVAGHAILVAIARALRRARQGPFDAALIGCFGEPGLLAARELFDLPVVGMAESAMLQAAATSRRFVVVTTGANWPEMLWELAALYGVRDRCVDIVAAPATAMSLHADRIMAGRVLAETAAAAVARTGAEAVVLGGAVTVGHAPWVESRAGVPTIDGLEAALRRALDLAGGNAKPERKAESPRPSVADFVDVDPDLLSFLAAGTPAASIASESRNPVLVNE
jgi:Asp/Glu/hydantoin racemase